MFLKVSQNSEENTYEFEKETPKQMFSFQFCEIFKNTLFTEHHCWLFLGLKYIKMTYKFVFILSWKIAICPNYLANIYFNIAIKVWNVKVVGVFGNLKMFNNMWMVKLRSWRRSHFAVYLSIFFPCHTVLDESDLFDV